MAFKTIFDPGFKYRRADETDVRLTFARVRREQRKAQPTGGGAALDAKVVPIGTVPLGSWPFAEARERAAG